MTIYEKIERAKKQYGYNNRILGEVVGKEEPAFGASMRRKSLSDLEIKELEKFLNNNEPKIENPQQKEEGFLQRHYEKIISNYIDLVDRVSRESERLQKELDLERSKNNKQ